MYTKKFSWIYSAHRNNFISNFGILINLIIFVYFMISCGKYHVMKWIGFFRLTKADLFLATLQF